jgi:hypothetical protein
MSSTDDSHYFYVLHQVEIDLDILHEELLEAPKNRMDYWVKEWFNRRSNVTGDRRKPSQDFLDGVYRWKQVEKELEEE